MLQLTAEWGTGVLLLGALLSAVLNWCKMAVFWRGKVKDCQRFPLSPPQDPQCTKRYQSQVSMEEYRKRVVADAFLFSSVLWRILHGEVISIYLFLSIYSVTSSQFVSCKAVQPSFENHNFLIAFNLLPTLLSDTPSLAVLSVSIFSLHSIHGCVDLYSQPFHRTGLKITDQA